MALSNDERGWVMTCLSGIACVLGASIICIDILIRQFPGKKNFRIQDSDSFLSASLSLSFGVMLFSALYTMLPSAKTSLIDGGYSPKRASWTLIGCFLGGVIGIQILSNIMHHFIPSHTVDCEHTHEEAPLKKNGAADDHDHDHSHGHDHVQAPRPQTPRSSLPGHIMTPNAGRRRTSRQTSYFGNTALETSEALTVSQTSDGHLRSSEVPEAPMLRRPSLHERVTHTITRIATGKKNLCDHNGPCHGFTDPCGQECFKNVNARGGFRAPTRLSSISMKPPMSRSATTTSVMHANEQTPLLHDIAEETRPQTDNMTHAPTRYYTSNSTFSQRQTGDSSDNLDENNESDSLHKIDTLESTTSDHPDLHHHHVPTNAFLSIGLQTSIAIALHKLPEGFITYATNHANPKLGVSVFLALFIHNITEGFAMALPLYLAINSRVKAMLISFVLGGLSQPIGAAVAAIWFKLAGSGNWAPSEGVYGGMFAVTAGIMASVALQLFSESLDLTHSRALCMVGAFTGMGILGISSALTA